MKKVPSISEIGKVYGKLTVIAIIPSVKGSGAKAQCLCSCGKERTITIYNLRKYPNLCCLDCKKIYEQSEENKQYNRTMMLDLIASGEYDKSHLKRPKTQEWKDKIAISVSKVNKRGKDSPLYGKSTYILLEEKYGKEEAIFRFQESKRKQSLASSGKNNPMYNRPSPMGSGYGWKGWYKNFYFKSLRELACIINHFEKQQLSWSSGEQISIPYKGFDGQERTYRPDFLVDCKYLVECKPIKLHKSPTVLLKTTAAKEYCKTNNLKYVLIDPVKLTDQEIQDLYNQKIIKFTDKYDKLYQERYHGLEY